MAEPLTYVVDASVATKWMLQLPDEAHTEIAIKIRRDFEEGKTRLIAPDYFRAEIGHAVLRAVRQYRISPAQGEQGLELEVWPRSRLWTILWSHTETGEGVSPIRGLIGPDRWTEDDNRHRAQQQRQEVWGNRLVPAQDGLTG